MEYNPSKRLSVKLPKLRPHKEGINITFPPSALWGGGGALKNHCSANCSSGTDLQRVGHGWGQIYFFTMSFQLFARLAGPGCDLSFTVIITATGKGHGCLTGIPNGLSVRWKRRSLGNGSTLKFQTSKQAKGTV